MFRQCFKMWDVYVKMKMEEKEKRGQTLNKGNLALIFRLDFGECPLYFSALQNSQNVFKVLFSQSQFDHLRYNSLTLALSQKLVVNLLDPILLSLIVWPHRNFRWLLILSIGSAYIHVKMATSYLSRNMITTRFWHTPLIWFAIKAYVIIYVSITQFESWAIWITWAVKKR